MATEVEDGSRARDPSSILQTVLTWYRRRNRLGDVSAAAVLLGPVFVLLAVFTLLPIAYSAYLSTIEWDGLSRLRPFVGFENFIRLWKSGELGQSVQATVLYTIGVAAGSVVAGLGIALMIGRLSRGQALYRAIYFLPAVTATVAISVVWKLLLDPGRGYVNVSLRELGIQGPNWLRDATWALPAVIMVGIWKQLGFNVIVYLAGMHTIPRHVLEAAMVDGASGWRLVRSIVLPLLAPITLLLTIVNFINGFLVFDQVFVLTGGGPLGTTDVLGMLLYRTAFQFFDLGGAAAVGWVMFALVAGGTLVQWRFYGTGTRGVG